MPTEQPSGNDFSSLNPKETSGILHLQKEKIRREKEEAKRFVRGILGTTDSKDKSGIPSYTNPLERISFNPEQKVIAVTNPFITEAVRTEIDRLSPMGVKRGETLAIFQLAIHQAHIEQKLDNKSSLREGALHTPPSEQLVPSVPIPDLPYYPDEAKIVRLLFSHIGQATPLSAITSEANISMDRSKGKVANAVQAYLGLIKRRLEPHGYSLSVDPETKEVTLSPTAKT